MSRYLIRETFVVYYASYLVDAMNSAPASPARAALLQRALAFLGSTLGVPQPAPHTEAAVQRALSAAPQEGLADLLARATRGTGIAATVVVRPLADVIADADPAFPWVAFRRRADDTAEGLAVLSAARGGARVVELGSEIGPSTWSRAGLRDWLGLSDDRATVTWVVAEATASLGGMRTADGAARMEPYHRLRALLGNERRTLWIALVYSVVIGLLSLVAPVAVQSLVNTIAFGSSRQPLLVLTLFVLVALSFSTVMNAGRAFVIEVMQRSIFARVASDVTWRLVRVRADAFDRFHGPELVNRFFDTVTVQKSAALLLIDGLSIVMQTTIGLLLLALYHPWLLAFDILLVAAMLGIVFGLGRGAVHSSIKESKAKYALEAWLEQIAAHLVTFKSAGGATLAFERSHDLLEDYLTYRAAHFRILIRQIVGAFALQAIASAALLGIGGWLVINRQLTLGQLVASELVVTLMLSAFAKFGKQLEVFYDLSAAIDKLGDLVDLPLEDAGGTATLPTGGPVAVQLRDATLHFSGAAPPALTIDRLDIPAGHRLGITGSHGAGKSTLADVLFGLRHLSRGVVLIDERDTREIALDEWRSAVALVRHVELFPGTVAHNIRLGSDVSEERIIEALRVVGLLAELRALPNGLETVLQPHGRPLSHRQACRLMLARAMVHEPRLLIVDGLLDQLDRGNERDQVIDALFADAAPWTLLCVTEQADLLARCSRVVRLHQGTVADVAVGGETR